MQKKRLKVLALIPARGGSKSVPKKNIRLLAGRPLIAHVIGQAKQAQSINRIIVSTDDLKIAAISKKYGAEVIFRPAKISTDEASSELALLHALEFLQKKEGYKPDIVVFLQCTSPLTISQDIVGIVKAFLDKQADSALAVAFFHGFLWKMGADGKVLAINHNKAVRIRRQDLNSQYWETGAVYVMKTEGFLKAKNRFFGKIILYPIPAERSLDIDSFTDFYIAEVLLRQKKRKS